MRRIALLLAVLTIAPLGCRGGSTPAPAAPAPVATTLQLAPSPLELAEHQTGRLRATVLDQTWAKMDLPILWQSSDPAVATVTDSAGVGVVAAIGVGTALISARAHNQLTTTIVRVVPGLAVNIFQSDAASSADLASAASTSCYFELAAVASGGAPGDSATWEESQIEFLDANGTQKIDTLDKTEMLDRFGRSVIRSGDTLRTRRLVATPMSGPRIVNRIRWTVGGEAHSLGVTINCSRSAGSTR